MMNVEGSVLKSVCVFLLTIKILDERAFSPLHIPLFKEIVRVGS